MTRARPQADQALVPTASSQQAVSTEGFDPSRGLFNYTVEQHENIRRGDHPDCCVDDVCSYCGASEANLLACAGLQSELARDLFQTASAKARNANVRSIGQWTNWETHDRDARLLDRAARAIATEARRAETKNTGSVHDGPVAESDAANPKDQ